MAEYVKDVEKFREDTPLVLFCQAVPYMERDPPPGLKTLVTGHQWPCNTRRCGRFQGKFFGCVWATRMCNDDGQNKERIIQGYVVCTTTSRCCSATEGEQRKDQVIQRFQGYISED